MKITFNGAAGIVTGSCHLLTINDNQYLLDCGMFQGTKDITKLNFLPFAFDPSKIKAVILSHAHIDHSGLLPKLCKEGFKGKVYCTKATKDLCEIMLEDSAYIQERETEYDNRKLKSKGLPLRQPLYGKKDVVECMKIFKDVAYNERTQISPDISFTLRDAGHILGSAIVEVFAKEDVKEKKIVFSGDLGQPNLPIIKDPTFIEEADYVLVESTYGGREHESIAKRRKMLLDIIKRNFEKKGRLMIPSFAVERAQELIYRLNEFSEKGLMPKMKVFVDSPLTTKATEVFMRHHECYDEEIMELIKKDDNPFEFPMLQYIKDVRDSKKLNTIKEPCIIIAGSGMCNGGRIKHHLANHLKEKNSTVLFIGYQAYGTLGRIIRDGAKKAKIYGQWYDIKAEIKAIGGFSAHADKHFLLRWLNKFKGKPKVLIIHGESRESDALAEALVKFNDNYHIPYMHETVKLD